MLSCSHYASYWKYMSDADVFSRCRHIWLIINGLLLFLTSKCAMFLYLRIFLIECIAHLAVARDIWSVLIINVGLGLSYTPTWCIILLYVMLGPRMTVCRFGKFFSVVSRIRRVLQVTNTINSRPIFGDIEINTSIWKCMLTVYAINYFMPLFTKLFLL